MRAIFFTFLLCCRMAQAQQKDSAYFPPANAWDHRTATLYFDTARLSAAIAFAKQNESKAPRDMAAAQAATFGREPYGQAIGPFADRGDPTGLVILHGYIVAAWGDPDRVDMTHSVTKSFLSTAVGVAVDEGRIRSVYDTVANYVSAVQVFDRQDRNAVPSLLHPFASPHNRTLTWDVMLRQTSDWEGSLWGKPDWSDRPDVDSTKWQRALRHKPGSVFEYNDVRVNALALAAASVWKKGLPEVLKEKIMDPIGASTSWHWEGYDNSWIELDGHAVQSVSGGGHWGGGMFINAYDLARFGLLSLHGGRWKNRQLISKQWMQQALTPTAAQPTYGYMNFFLNTDQKYLHGVPLSAFVHLGNGANIIYVDPSHDLVIVARWIENSAINAFVLKMLDALK